VTEARRALAARDTQRIRSVAHELRDAAPPKDALARASSGTLMAAASVIDAARRAFEPVMENVS
jgi:hypothetical protein